MRGLRLAEHRGRIERLPPRAGEELGGAEDDGGAIFPRRPRPVLPRVGRGGDRAIDLGGAALVDVGEHVVALVRHDCFERVAGLDFLAADHERDLEALAGELVEAAAELVALGAAGLVAEHRLVVGLGNAEDAVGAHDAILGFSVVPVTQVAYEVEGWGVGELVVADERVVWHELPWPSVRGRLQDPSQTPTHPGLGPVVSRKASRGSSDFVTEVVQVLQAYFAGERAPIEEVPVDLEYETPFLARCAEALRTIPRGEVVTYGELAALAGAPRAARAAGSFCARSRLSIFVPCHRVVGADGLGSYGSYGLEYKRRLLALEGYADAL